MAANRTLIMSLLFLASFLFPAQARPIADVHLNVEQVRKLNVKTAASDAKVALARGDKRLLAVYGITLLVPNGPSEGDQDAGRNINGLKILDGTSDSIRNAADQQLNDNAWAYAKIYNRTVLSAR